MNSFISDNANIFIAKDDNKQDCLMPNVYFHTWSNYFEAELLGRRDERDFRHERYTLRRRARGDVGSESTVMRRHIELR